MDMNTLETQPLVGGGVQTDITGRLYYSSVNRAYELMDGSVELQSGYTGFTITDVVFDIQDPIPNVGEQTTVRFVFKLTVDDISHIGNDNGPFAGVMLSASVPNSGNYTLDYNITRITGNIIYTYIDMTGIWNENTTYNDCTFILDDDLGNREFSPSFSIEVNVKTDQPVDPNASITIDSSTENDRRWQSYDSYTNGRYNITSGYGGWDVTLNNITTEYLDLQNITMSIVSCSNSSSSGALRSVTFDGTTDKGTNTKFGLNFSISDSISTRNANYDYTLEVNVPVTNGYSGTLTTQFTIKLYIY